MRKLSYIAAIILATGISLFGQQVLCSNVSVEGPAQILMPGEIATFTSRIQPLEPQWPVKYFWRVSSGKILSGKGTPSIRVESHKYYVIASVSLGGIPMEEHCPANASWMARWNIKPEAEKIASVRGHKFEPPIYDYGNVQNRVWTDDHLVVFLGFSGNPSEEAIRTRPSDIIEKLGDKFESTRTTFHNVFGIVDITEFWRVPPGADDPICEGCKAMACPTISVKGPVEITNPGDTMKFSVNPLPAGLEKLVFRWTVSAGAITEGQGKPGITVQTTRELSGETITAKVEVMGLPERCSRTAEENATVSRPFHPHPDDVFGRLRPNDEKGRLDMFFYSLTKSKDHIGYVILRFSKAAREAELRKRVKRIKDHSKYRRFPLDRIVILAEPSDIESTILWRMPPGADESVCSGCRRY